MCQFLKSTVVWVTQHPRAAARLRHCCQVTSMCHARVRLILSVSLFNELLFKTLAQSSSSCDRRHSLHLKSRKTESKSPSWQALRDKLRDCALLLLVSDRQLPYKTVGIKVGIFAFHQGQILGKERWMEEILQLSTEQKPTEYRTYDFSLKLAR